MSDEVKIAGIVTIGAVLVFGSFAGCTAHTDYRIGQAIESGADPIKARCALGAFIDPAVCAASIK